MTSSILGRTEDYLGRIGRYDADLRAFISVRGDAARREAAELDGRLQNGDYFGLAAGCVIALKDNIDIAGEATTLGSGFHSDRVPNSDAEVVRRLRRAGAVVVGKTNLHELAFGATTQNRISAPAAIPGIRKGLLAARVAAPRQRWRQVCARLPLAPIPAAPSACRRR